MSSPPSASHKGTSQRAYGGRSAADRRAERRERIMAAALELFGTDGYAATSIEKLCSRANVATRSFYEEFSGREALLIALHHRVNERAIQEVAAALAGAGDAPVPRRIELAVRAYVSVTASDPRWARIAYVEVIGVSATVEQARLELRRKWNDLLAVEANRDASAEVAATRDFRLTATAFIGAVNELVQHWALHAQHVPLDEITTELVRIAIAVIIAP